jgi:hypothetical protein
MGTIDLLHGECEVDPTECRGVEAPNALAAAEACLFMCSVDESSFATSGRLLMCPKSVKCTVCKAALWTCANALHRRLTATELLLMMRLPLEL